MTSIKLFFGLLAGIGLVLSTPLLADERVLIKDLGFNTGDYTDDIHSAATTNAVFVAVPIRDGGRDGSMICKVDESGNVVLQKDVRELFSGTSSISNFGATLRDLHTLGNNIYVTGDFWNFNSSFRLSYALKLDSSLNVVAAATFHGSSFSGTSVDLRSIYPVLKSDGSEEIFVAGDFDCSNVYVSSGALNQASQPAGYGLKVTKESTKR